MKSCEGPNWRFPARLENPPTTGEPRLLYSTLSVMTVLCCKVPLTAVIVRE